LRVASHRRITKWKKTELQRETLSKINTNIQTKNKKEKEQEKRAEDRKDLYL
jgi:hypothetical protein